MINSFSFILAIILSTAFAHPAPNDPKPKLAENNDVSPAKFAAKGVSAEYGGYKVAAGLGGGDAGGGLFARAESPDASAGSGAFGGPGGFGGYDGNKHGQNGGFFDRVFNIPISVLHSVNSYVKTKDDANHHGAGAAATAAGGPGSTLITETRFADDGSYSSASSSSSSGSGPAVTGHKVRGKPDYDKIFNIPKSALQSVNDFLNG